MREGSSGPGPALPGRAADSEATQTSLESRPLLDDAAGPATQPSAEAVRPPAPEHSEQPGQPPGIVRYGPGVPATPPAGQVELTVERVWHPGGPAGPSRRARVARLAGWVLTVILLATSGVVLYLRFHHAPFRVTGVEITQQTHNGCGVEVTGRITTSGSAGTVSYQWVLRPDTPALRPLNQSVAAGQAVYVTVAVEGRGHGSTSRTVTLQVLGPDAAAASADVVVSCP